MKDPFEAAVEEQESPPESPVAPDEDTVAAAGPVDGDDEDAGTSSQPSTSAHPAGAAAGVGAGGKDKEDEDDEEEDHMDVEFGKLPAGAPTDPDKMAKMQAILSQFTEEQMSRYESFRRSGFQKSNMKRLLTSITGSQKISLPMTIVVSGIGKMFVGELIETSRVVMTERKESGAIRPCHIREAYRRLKLEGKIPRRSVPRLFR